MLNFLLLSGMISFGVVQNVLKKEYGRKTNGSGVYLFSGMLTLVSSAFFMIISGFKLQLDGEMLIYSLFLSMAYFFAVIFSHLSLVSGPLSITSLAISFAMIVPMVFGIVFYNESITLALAFGFLLLVISFFLMNEKKSEKKVTLKWLVYVGLAFIGNGMFSVVLSLCQRRFGGENDNQIMVIAMFVSAVLILGISAVKERKELKKAFCYGWHRAAATGCLNGGANLCMLLLMRTMSISLISPISSGGSVVLSALVGIFIYKERPSVKQCVGIAFGTLAVVLLSL